jgi:eukaryotic-like serine/threonine-protein kinase
VKDRDPSPRFVITTVFLIVVLAISAITFEYNPSQHTIMQQQALAQPASSFLTYDNPTHGIKMQYPADWTVSTNGLQSYSDIVGFFSPLQNLTDVLPAQVALSSMSYSANVSLDEYTNMTLTEIEQQGLEVNESNAFTLAGNPGYRIIFSPPPQTVPVSLSIMQAWTVINDKVYLLAYTAEGSEFQNNLSLVQQMLDSLQVQPQQKP